MENKIDKKISIVICGCFFIGLLIGLFIPQISNINRIASICASEVTGFLMFLAVAMSTLLYTDKKE